MYINQSGHFDLDAGLTGAVYPSHHLLYGLVIHGRTRLRTRHCRSSSRASLAAQRLELDRRNRLDGLVSCPRRASNDPKYDQLWGNALRWRHHMFSKVSFSLEVRGLSANPTHREHSIERANEDRDIAPKAVGDQEREPCDTVGERRLDDHG